MVRSSDLYAVTGPACDIVRIDADPSSSGFPGLFVGCRAGANLRGAIAQELPEEMAEGTPLYLLLDDLAGSTLISGFAYLRWADHVPMIKNRVANAPAASCATSARASATGASSLLSDGSLSGLRQNTAVPGLLADPDDPLGWHQLDDHPEIAMRRVLPDRCVGREWGARDRRDVPRQAAGILAAPRSSCTSTRWSPAPTGPPESCLPSRPRRGCSPMPSAPGAAPNASWMAGTDLRAMRTEVLQRLRATDCCTDLNDGLRSLAEVPVLARSLAV